MKSIGRPLATLARMAILFTMVGGIMVAKQGGRYGVQAPAGEVR